MNSFENKSLWFFNDRFVIFRGNCTRFVSFRYDFDNDFGALDENDEFL